MGFAKTGSPERGVNASALSTERNREKTAKVAVRRETLGRRGRDGQGEEEEEAGQGR